MRRGGSEIMRVLWVTLGLNVAVALAKLLYGLHAHVLSMAADGVHSFLDGGGNVVGLIAVAAASRPPDDEHPYGHRKFETFAALAIGGFLVLASYEILKAAIDRFVHGGVPHPGPVGYVVIGLSMVVSLGVSTVEARAGRRLKSEVLIADAAHTRSDLVTSATVLVALIGSHVGWPWVDPVVTVVLVAWIGWLAWHVIQPALATLSDEARIDARAIDLLVMSVPGVRDVHRIRTRGAADAIFLDLHLQVDPHASVGEAHDVAHEVEQILRRTHPELVDVIVHVEPHGDPVEGLDGNIVGPPR